MFLVVNQKHIKLIRSLHLERCSESKQETRGRCLHLPQKGRKEASMTPQEKILLVVSNIPENYIAGFAKDFMKAADYANSVVTYKTNKERENCRKKLENLSNIIFFYLKQGGMTKNEWEKIDRTYGPMGEHHWNQFKCLLEIREEILAICEMKKEA